MKIFTEILSYAGPVNEHCRSDAIIIFTDGYLHSCDLLDNFVIILSQSPQMNGFASSSGPRIQACQMCPILIALSM
jgi:hypothetical protein